MKIKIIGTLLLVSVLMISCFEDMDDNIKPASTLEIQNFIYRGLNYYYLYKANSPKLADDAFANEEEKEKYLRRFATPEELFEKLKVRQDRFSRLFPDYNVIEDALAGVSMSNGMEYGLVYYPDNSGNVFGYVRYVLPNTDAQTRGLKRGDLFTTVNGVQLNETNYSDLLSQNNYSIGLATYNGDTFQPTGNSVQLNKIQYEENPVYLSKTLNIAGRKIGYLMYNAFTRNYDSQLNDAVGRLKSEGITDFVLDLRYNGGGSVETATDLASMITGQFNGEIFYKEIWNADRQQERARNGLFDNTISNGAAINSLNLSKVYILTTSGTASASELVINGLKPYINVKQVGDTTTGKFQASFLLYDAPAPNFSKQQASVKHKYVMLPLVFKTANKAGKTDYTNGLFPNIELKENYFNLGKLGNPEEPLLAAALNDILGLPREQPKDFYQPREISGSEQYSILNGLMVVDGE
ncbi:peptidase S41 [Aequorivita sp. H23M31]|uniref:Peptidase S41 n=1 Tax=Aequorivita ciconiae TaxID=2494375 RepID=A0A410G729_9FLAO|nr:S41 family peptidase [Aequorivita sp. H23M31]QAA83066.1 peptidase S41 [Aequorivita sp. H23M31]